MTSHIERLNQALRTRYEIQRELASGGTATVYLANDLRYRRQVAVKVFRTEVAEALGHERFVREIALAATLNHPHIVPLLDSGDADGVLYYVMPAVEGESLRERLTRVTALPLDEAIQVARDVAVALDYAHGRDVVHRDIKPENILLTAGTAVVADFGIAKMLNAGAAGFSLTRAGLTVGTVAYMSPEQASAGEVDRRSDIYALGCVLFEMLTGQAPFTGTTTRALVAAHFTAPVPSLRAVLPDVAATMDLVLAKAMAKNPEDRFATATAFIDELIAARKTASRERIFKRMGLDEASARLAAGEKTDPMLRRRVPVTLATSEGAQVDTVPLERHAAAAAAAPTTPHAASELPVLRGAQAPRFRVVAVIASLLALAAVAWMLWRAR